MSKNIRKTIKKSLNALLETKGFEHMEVAFGVKEKSDNLSDAEKEQFGPMETIQNEKGVKLGKASVQPALNKVHKEDKKDEDAYFKDVEKKMKTFQKTEKSEPSQIGESSVVEDFVDIGESDSGLEMRLKDCLKRCSKNEDQEGCERALCDKIRKEMGEPVNEAFDPPKVTREDDQTEPEEVYSTEALGPGMLALRYDNEGTPVYDKFEDRMEEMNGDDLTYKKLKGYGEKYLKHKYDAPDEYHYTPKVRATDKAVNETYINVLEENIFKVKGTIKSKEQIIKLVDKLPERVKVDETVFAVTDGENEYRLIWEGSEDGEAIITHEKNNNTINENIKKMKHLWEFKSSDTASTNKNISESNDDVFVKMMNKVRGKETLNEDMDDKSVPFKSMFYGSGLANMGTISKVAKKLPNNSEFGEQVRHMVKQDKKASQELKDLVKDNPNDADLGLECRKMCK